MSGRVRDEEVRPRRETSVKHENSNTDRVAYSEPVTRALPEPTSLCLTVARTALLEAVDQCGLGSVEQHRDVARAQPEHRGSVLGRQLFEHAQGENATLHVA